MTAPITQDKHADIVERLLRDIAPSMKEVVCPVSLIREAVAEIVRLRTLSPPADMGGHLAFVLDEIAKACEERAHPAGPYLLSKPHVEDMQDIAAKAREALSALTALQRAEWQDISTAPRNGRSVLLWWKSCKDPAVGRWEDDETGSGWRCDGDDCIPVNQDHCTHWQPLPAAPILAEKRGE